MGSLLVMQGGEEEIVRREGTEKTTKNSRPPNTK